MGRTITKQGIATGFKLEMESMKGDRMEVWKMLEFVEKV
jgi:hypothetical protein